MKHLSFFMLLRGRLSILLALAALTAAAAADTLAFFPRFGVVTSQR